MNCTDIIAAAEAGDRTATEEAFRALVDFPHEERVEGTPDELLAALDSCCATLIDDRVVMPAGTCRALGIPAGSSYHQGAGSAQAGRDALQRRFAAYSPSYGSEGVLQAGRAM